MSSLAPRHAVRTSSDTAAPATPSAVSADPGTSPAAPSAVSSAPGTSPAAPSAVSSAPGTSPAAPPAVASGGAAPRAGSSGVVGLVAQRLADPDAVAAVASRDDNRDPVYDAVMWGPLTLANGLPGTALLHGELAREDASWRTVAHRHLAAAGHALRTAPSRGLFSGPAALLAAAQTCAGPQGHYAALRRRLADWVAADQSERLAVFRARADDGGQGVDWAAYDLVNGLSGTTRLLLDAVEDPAERSPEAARALRDSLLHLVRLTEPVTVDGPDGSDGPDGPRTVPGWWVPAALQVSERDRATYPHGDFNLGMAHGVAGPLTVLATAAERGHRVPGLPEAAHRVAEWLLGWTLSDDAGPYWPARAGWSDETAADRPTALFTRTAWCYGTPGVAAALHRAGEVFGQPRWRTAAVEGLRAALRRDEKRWAIEGPTVCHGYAGLLAVVSRVAEASGDDDLLAGRARLTAKVLDCLDEEAPFAFRHLMRYPAAARSPVPHRALDVAGMLEGATGVALALLPPVSGPRPWDRCLGLA